MAAIQAPSASQPTDRQTPSHGLIRLPAPSPRRRSAASSGGRPRPRFGATAPAQVADDEVLQPVVDLDVDEPGAVRRWQRGVADAAARLAVLALAGGQDDPVVAVGGPPDDLEPAVGVGDERAATRRAASEAPASRLSSPATTSSAPGRRRRRWRSGRSRGSSGRRRAMTASRAPSGDHSNASTSMPVAVRTVGRGRLRVGRPGGRGAGPARR